MNRADLEAAIRVGATLRGADLRGADLSGADLSWAVLTGADLSGANLSWANLGGADLGGANLSGANLSWGNLSWATLRGAEGVTDLPVGDPRGYRPIAAVDATGAIRIYSVCRSFTIPEAREHWGEAYAGDRETGDRYLHGLDWLGDRTL